MNRTAHLKALLFAASLLLAGAALADTINWPANDEWTPLYSDGILFSDGSQDTGNNGHLHLDIVGDSTYAGAYLLYRPMSDAPGETEDQLLIRLRLNDAKNKMSGAYQIFFETDGDADVEWVLHFTTDNLNSSGLLEFGSASGTNLNSVAFGPTAWTGSYAGNVNWTGTATGDGSAFNGDPDYFLDLSMPWTTFSSLTQIQSTNDPFRVLITSSQTAGVVGDADVGNSSLAATVGFSFVDAYSDTIPEPAVAALLIGAGIGLIAGRRLFLK